MTTAERTIQIIRETWSSKVSRFAKELGIKEPTLNINLTIPAVVMAQTDFTWKHDGVKYTELISNNAIYIFNVYVQFIRQLPEEAQRQITVAVLSHELRHCYQLVHEYQRMLDDFNSGKALNGASQAEYIQRWSERDANAFAALKVSPLVMETVMLMQTASTQDDLNRIFANTKAIKTNKKGMSFMKKAMQTIGFGGMAAGEAVFNQSEEMESMENQTTETNTGTNIGLNEIAAGTLNKTVDTAVAVTQFAVGATISVGHITLGSVNKWFTDGTEAINKQFNGMVNRIFGVKG